MPFVVTGGGRLEDRIDEAAPGRCARRIADAAGDKLLTNIQRRTPVDMSPTRDHERRHLRDTFERTRVEEWPAITGPSFRMYVRTFDPIGPYVEWTTRPHNIPNAFGFGPNFGIGGRFEDMFHPGTQGQHMVSLGAAATDADLPEIAHDPINRMLHELVR